MTWNSSPPRGGPMVKVKGFPRPLHVGDRDGPDVIAYKRTAARCGAWPWDPDGWDDTYSSRFAYGDNPDTHAGIEGLQHWSGTLDATGNLGEKTFNFLRSVRVPQGRTHAGEMAMDSVAAQLVDQAYDTAHPPITTTLRETALEIALGELGVTESPAGSNRVEYSDWYGLFGPWCAMFCTWCYETAGDSPSFARAERYAYVPYIVSDARGGRYGLSVASGPVPGDLVCYAWGSSGASSEEFDHVGIFEAWTGAHTFQAIEGNTSVSNDSNGGEVMRRQRDVNGQGTVFVRVAE